jgi:hypothetical protein
MHTQLEKTPEGQAIGQGVGDPPRQRLPGANIPKQTAYCLNHCRMKILVLPLGEAGLKRLP